MLAPPNNNIRLPLAMSALLMGCTGGHAKVRADHTTSPVSLSGSLPDQAGNVYVVGHSLREKGSFKFKRRTFATLYGTVPKKTIDISEDLNRVIETHGGDGIVQLRVTNRACASNWFFPLNVLPFYPGCVVVVAEGVVVELPPGAPADFIAGETQGIAVTPPGAAPSSQEALPDPANLAEPDAPARSDQHSSGDPEVVQ